MMSPDIIDDDVFQRLMTFANVLVTGHQGFFTVKAMHEIAQVTSGTSGTPRPGAHGRNNVPGS